MPFTEEKQLGQPPGEARPPGDIRSKIKSALVDRLLDTSEARPERARALGQAILHVWPGFRNA